MKKGKLMFILFIGLALAMAAFLLLDSRYLRSDAVDAGSFGISPPYVNAGDLTPGASYSQQITVMRGSAADSQFINASIKAETFAPWVTVTPPLAQFARGEKRTTVTVTITIPENAYIGAYQGGITLGLGARPQATGVGIALGAHVSVSFRVIDGREQPATLTWFGAADNELYRRTAGKILIVVDDFGKSYFVDSAVPRMIALHDFPALRDHLRVSARGMSRNDLWKIPVALSFQAGPDTDGDGLSDAFELALGTNMYFADSDDDGLDDRYELENGLNPSFNEEVSVVDMDFALRQAGHFFLAVENRGEIWFVSTRDNKRYLIANQVDLLQLIRDTGIGISGKDFNQLKARY